MIICTGRDLHNQARSRFFCQAGAPRPPKAAILAALEKPSWTSRRAASTSGPNMRSIRSPTIWRGQEKAPASVHRKYQNCSSSVCA